MDFDYSKQPLVPSTKQGMVNMINKLGLHFAAQEEQISKLKKSGHL